jgi:hypothetical protein
VITFDQKGVAHPGSMPRGSAAFAQGLLAYQRQMLAALQGGGSLSGALPPPPAALLSRPRPRPRGKAKAARHR